MRVYVLAEVAGYVNGALAIACMVLMWNGADPVISLISICVLIACSSYCFHLARVYYPFPPRTDEEEPQS